MNKGDLIKDISEQTGVSKENVRCITTHLMRLIYKNTQNNSKISLRGFGTFQMTSIKSKRSYNISTHSIEVFPATRKLKFTPSQSLKNSVKQQEKRLETTDRGQPSGQAIRRSNKIIEGRLNIGKRRENTAAYNQMEIEYDGEVSVGKYLGGLDHLIFPALKTPKLGTPILKYQNIDRGPITGITEPLLLQELRKLCNTNTELTIIENVAIPIKGWNKPYIPDFVLYQARNNLYIDIEIDEPYDIKYRKPIHYIGSNDVNRDNYLTSNGWVVIRYSERQVYKHLEEIIKDLESKINWLTYDDVCPTSLTLDNRWTEEEAKRLAEENYREKYLGITTAIKENLIDENDYDELYEDSHQSGAGMSLESRWYNSDEALVNQIDYIVNALRPKYVRVTLKDSRQFILDGDSVKLNTHWYKSISGICSYGDTPGEQNKGPWKITEISKIEPLESLFTDFYWVQGKSTESELYNKLIEASLDGTPIWIKLKDSERCVRHLYLTGKNWITTLPNYMVPFTEIGDLKNYYILFYLHGTGIGDYENISYEAILEMKVINCTKDYPTTRVYEESLRTLICKEQKYKDDWKCIDYLIANKERFRIDDSVYQKLIDKYELEKGNLD